MKLTSYLINKELLAALYAHLFLKDLGNSDFQFDNAEDIEAYKLRMKELKKREKLLMSGRET